MMLKLLPVVLVIGLGIHGLIHLMGFVAYWPLKDVPELAYKTAFLGGRVRRERHALVQPTVVTSSNRFYHHWYSTGE